MPQYTNSKPAILFVADNADTRFGVADTLRATDYDVYERDTPVRAFQLLTIYAIDLIVVGDRVGELTGPSFVRTIRSDAEYDHIPVIVVSEDDADASGCLASFEAGAEDFLLAPFVPAVLLARIKRLLRKSERTTTRPSMSVEVPTEELPSILQFMQTELKTGRLEIKSPHARAVFSLSQGRLVSARAPFCTGNDAVAEVLSWRTIHVSFREQELAEEDFEINQDLTNVVMNCAVEVDEYREIKSKLPAADSMFEIGKKRLPRSAPDGMRQVYEAANAGATIDEIVNDLPISRVKAVLWLNELIEGGQLALGDPPFHRYADRLRETYHGLFLQRKLEELRPALAEIPFPLSQPEGMLPQEACDWIAPAPKLLVAGDDPGTLELFVSSMVAIHVGTRQKRPPTHLVARGVNLTRLDFGRQRLLDIQTLPSMLDDQSLASLDEWMSDTCAVLFLVSNQDSANARNNLRLLRQLRRRFRGVYYLAVARIKDKQGQAMFKMNCMHCQYKLSVNMDDAGLGGECPVCGNDLHIPDPMDLLANRFNLPDTVPVVLLKPDSSRLCRDVMLMLFDAILEAARAPEPEPAPEPAPAPVPVAAPEPAFNGNSFDDSLPPRAMATTQKLIIREHLQPPGEKSKVSTETQPNLILRQKQDSIGRAESPSTADGKLPLRRPGVIPPDLENAPASHAEADEKGHKTVNLNELLTDDDDFDVDEFIDLIKG